MSSLIVKFAETSEELEQAFFIRYKVFCEEVGFFRVSDFPDGLLKDEYDDYSLQCIAVKDGIVVGTSRITPYISGRPFLIEKDVDLPDIFCREKSVEFSRGAILKEHRNMLGILLKVLDFMYEYCKERGILQIATFANLKMYLLYKKMGAPFLYVGDRKIINGFESVPLIFEVRSDFRILGK
ncbi:GNAT family N-acetyltransferase [Candidatus Wolfebacteria bacterium]|nr:GNAT family N-acetyltransferase [Candidatus Wolfebacteria bacterium]